MKKIFEIFGVLVKALVRILFGGFGVYVVGTALYYTITPDQERIEYPVTIYAYGVAVVFVMMLYVFSKGISKKLTRGKRR